MRLLLSVFYAVAVTLVLGLVDGGVPAPAAPAVLTRSDYVAQVDPICREGIDANRGLLRGVEEMIVKGKLKRASHRFSRAAAALRQAREQISVVPRPPADVPRLTKWLELVKEQETLLRQMASALKQHQRPLVQKLAQRLLRGAKQANRLVADFDFEYCRLNPADFV
jgi:uncharacterized membrane protein YccC